MVGTDNLELAVGGIRVKRRISRHEQPLVSVCITSLNYAQYINDAITSVLTQSYPNIEVVVSDNGSSDDTFEVLAAYRKDPRVKVYVNDTQLSMVENHNAAIRHARGEYIVVLSADDILLPNHIATLVSRIFDPADPVDIAMGHATYLDADLQPLGNPYAQGVLPLNYSRRDEFASMVFCYAHMYPAKMIPKAIYEELGYFDENLLAFDVDFSLRIEAAGYRVAFVPQVVAALRMHGTSATTNLTHKLGMYHRDKLTYLSKFLNAEHGWRFEYVGVHIAHLLEFERGMIPAEQLDGQLLAFSQSVCEQLISYAGQHTTWPASRPRISVIVHTLGATKQLLASLDALWAQNVPGMEILVIQSQGIGIGPLLQGRAYSQAVRWVQAPYLHNVGGVMSLGIDLARGQYVSYLEEGQTTAQDQLASLLRGIEETQADFVYSDASEIQVVHTLTSTEGVGHTPFIPVQRGEVLPAPGSVTFSQILMRRNLLLGTNIFEALPKVEEAEFTTAMKVHFRYVFFERRPITEAMSIA